MKRLIIKADWQDASEHPRRGCIFALEHIRDPRIMRILEAARVTAPVGVHDVVCSEGYRNIRDSPDAHERYHAFDFSLSGRNWDTGHAWAARMQARLGDDYFVICHRSATADGAPHIHAQLRIGH